jgi:predicted nucleotide-binding protein
VPRDEGSNKQKTSLAVIPADASAQILKQVEEGEAILPSVDRKRGMDELFSESRIWADYTSAILKRLFTSDDVADEFEAAGGPFLADIATTPKWRFGQRVEQVKAQIATLKSIDRRLQFFEVSVHGTSAGGASALGTGRSNEVFIVHGHDEGAKQSVARFLEKLGLLPVILHETADRGRTIIEKFEDHSAVGFAVVLLTPDDEGGVRGSGKVQLRGRQNVILELGYFIGKLGRSKVCALKVANVEAPSDMHGVLYISFDDSGTWRLGLARELKAAGIEIDMNLAL